MGTATQTDFFSSLGVPVAPPKPTKPYVVQQYRPAWVRENSFPVDKRTISSRTDVGTLARQLFGDVPTESVIIFAVDSANRVTGFYRITDDAANQCSFAPVAIFRFLISTGAVGFIMAHNHPGGSVEPSRQDWIVVKKLRLGGDAIDVKLLDSVIITETATVSMRELPAWGN